MPVNWGLGGQNNALANFGYGVQLGQNFVDRRDDRQQQNALLQLRQQEFGQRQEERQQQQAQQERQQRRADLPMMERLLTMAQDEPSYQQARQVAGQYGIDVSELPPTFDPAWREQQLGIVRALNTPQGQEALSTAGKQAMDMGYRPGTPEFTQATRQLVEASLAQPYMGSGGETRLYTPQIGGVGQVQGAQPYNPDEWEVVEEPMTPAQAAPTLSAAAQSQTITPEEAARVRQSLGPNGQAAFEDWMRRNNIVIGGR